ncbi:MAG: hypothetical protein ABI977_09045 [Acidobacteriota bacterium]
MWKAVFEVFKRLFTFNEDLNRLQAASKLHGDQIRELYDNQTRFQFELQLQKERDAQEREKEKLQLENRLLRERLERLSLPPSTSKPPDEPPKD